MGNGDSHRNRAFALGIQATVCGAIVAAHMLLVLCTMQRAQSCACRHAARLWKRSPFSWTTLWAPVRFPCSGFIASVRSLSRILRAPPARTPVPCFPFLLPSPYPLQSGKAKSAAPKAGAKKPVAKTAAKTTATKAKAADPHHLPAAKNFRVGNDIQPTRDLSRFVKWPRYVRVQRQRKVLYERLKVPPSINQFRKPLDRAEAAPLLKLLSKYAPESKKEKKARLEKEAASAASGAGASGPKPVVVKFGINHVTSLVEDKTAKLVVIASDVDPIEIVVWLPALCRKMGIPYAIVNNKGVLGAIVHQKKAAAVAITAVRPEDNSALEKVIETANAKFAANVVSRKKEQGVCGYVFVLVVVEGTAVDRTRRSFFSPPFPSPPAGPPPQVGWRHHGPQDPEAPREARQAHRGRARQACGALNLRRVATHLKSNHMCVSLPFAPSPSPPPLPPSHPTSVLGPQLLVEAFPRPSSSWSLCTARSIHGPRVGGACETSGRLGWRRTGKGESCFSGGQTSERPRSTVSINAHIFGSAASHVVHPPTMLACFT